MKIAQALQKSWRQGEDERKASQPDQPRTPLMYYIEYQYKKRYVTLCDRIGVKPQSLGKWLCKDIESII